jgi:uncharacterized protein DUF2505
MSGCPPRRESARVLEHHTEGNSTTVGLRYEFTGSLDPVARRLLGAKRPAWIQEVRVDASAAAGTITFEAERNPNRLHGSGRFTLSPSGDSTVRRLDGELVVAVPGIGRMAKGRIVPGLLRRLDIEAQALEQRIGSGESSAG